MLSDWSRIAFLFGSLHPLLRIFLNSAYPRKGKNSLPSAFFNFTGGEVFPVVNHFVSCLPVANTPYRVNLLSQS